MTDIVTWPDVFPVWQLSGYQYDQNLKLVRSDENLGYSPGVRIRQKKPPELVNGKLLLDEVSKSLFDWFYIRKLYHGALWFQGPVKRAEALEQKRIRIINLTVNALSGLHWPVTAKLELYD